MGQKQVFEKNMVVRFISGISTWYMDLNDWNTRLKLTDVKVSETFSCIRNQLKKKPSTVEHNLMGKEIFVLLFMIWYGYYIFVSFVFIKTRFVPTSLDFEAFGFNYTHFAEISWSEHSVQQWTWFI